MTTERQRACPCTPGHTIIKAQARSWDKLQNGALLTAAEQASFRILLTTDSRIRYQQNLAGRKIAIVVLTGSTKWSRVRLHLERIAAVVNAAVPSSYAEWKFLSIKFPKRVPRKHLNIGPPTLQISVSDADHYSSVHNSRFVYKSATAGFVDLAPDRIHVHVGSIQYGLHNYLRTARARLNLRLTTARVELLAKLQCELIRACIAWNRVGLNSCQKLRA